MIMCTLFNGNSVTFWHGYKSKWNNKKLAVAIKIGFLVITPENDSLRHIQKHKVTDRLTNGLTNNPID